MSAPVTINGISLDWFDEYGVSEFPTDGDYAAQRGILGQPGRLWEREAHRAEVAKTRMIEDAASYENFPNN